MLRLFWFVILLCVSGFLQASDHLQISHKVMAHENNGAYQTISLELTVNNFSNQNLHRVKLLPTSSEFSSNDQDQLINIGSLPSMGQAHVDLTVNTPVAVDYFESGMPIFFIIKAKVNEGENIEFPIYSLGGAAL